jgi:hypothetical protein
MYFSSYAVHKFSHEPPFFSPLKMRSENKQLGKRKGEKYPQRGEVHVM